MALLGPTPQWMNAEVVIVGIAAIVGNCPVSYLYSGRKDLVPISTVGANVLENS